MRVSCPHSAFLPRLVSANGTCRTLFNGPLAHLFAHGRTFAYAWSAPLASASSALLASYVPCFGATLGRDRRQTRQAQIHRFGMYLSAFGARKRWAWVPATPDFGCRAEAVINKITLFF